MKTKFNTGSLLNAFNFNSFFNHPNLYLPLNVLKTKAYKIKRLKKKQILVLPLYVLNRICLPVISAHILDSRLYENTPTFYLPLVSHKVFTIKGKA